MYVYIYKLTFVYDIMIQFVKHISKGGFTFPFKFPVKVTAQKVTQVSKNAANFGPKRQINWLGYIILLVLLLILIELGYLIWKKYYQNRADRS